MKSPAFQFYPADFLAGTCDLTTLEVGCYMRLLCFQWNRGSIPDQPDKLELIAGAKVSDDVMSKFPVGDDGQRRNERMESEREKQAQYRELQRVKGVKSGETRRTAVEPRLNRGSTEPEPRPVDVRFEPNGNSSSMSSSISSDKKKGDARSAPVVFSGEHKAFIEGWVQNFRGHYGFDYIFDGGKDGKAVKELLGTGILRIDLLEIAKKAWVRSGQTPKAFGCEQAATVHGFKQNLTKIRAELKNSESQSVKAGTKSAEDRLCDDLDRMIQ